MRIVTHTHRRHNHLSIVLATGIVTTASLLLLIASSSQATSSSAVGKTSASASDSKQLKKANDESHMIKSSAVQSFAPKDEATKRVSSETSAAAQPTSGTKFMAAESSQVATAVKQPVAEKKQGDAMSRELQQADSAAFNTEEYVQIKPEEITASDQKELDAAIAAAIASPSTQTSGSASQLDSELASEHKSADDELSLHLAQDVIKPLESAYGPQTAPAPASRASTAGSYPPPARPSYGAQRAPRPYSRQPRPSQPAPYRGPRTQLSGSRLPPSYITLKGKLTGINSIISQYPHPAPGYPHQGPRHLPRGAAAGYAAFRDFVRAHASKYKSLPMAAAQQSLPVIPMAGSYGPPAAPQHAAPAYGGESAPRAPPRQPSYGSGHESVGYGAGSGPKSYRNQQPAKSKVTVAQAYIPHMTPAAESGDYKGSSNQPAPYAAMNPVLAKLYGNHAPQGVGRPEYSKDYGMILHYPQATVYTEPMTVDQLYKLTGSGVTQILEHLQYNLANGHRDESNTLRGGRQHHLGHGLTIHAKEYYAPGKSGHYVPTTAAVISSHNDNKGTYGSSEPAPPAAAAPEYPAATGYKTSNADLGSGYERVKQAVAASQASGKYNYNNNKHPAQSSGGASTEYSAPPAAETPAPAYAAPQQSSSGKYLLQGNGEPLSALTNLLGSELESLYKANAALTKSIEPDVHAQIQAYASKPNAYGNGALNYHEIDSKAPLALQQLPGAGQNKYRPAPGYPRLPQAPSKGYHQQPRGQPHRGPRKSRYNSRPQNPKYQQSPRYPQQQAMQGYRQQAPGYGMSQMRPQQQQQSYGNRPHQAGDYMQQQAYKAAEQQLNQQVMQLLHDFQAGDEQYHGKGKPTYPASQGYPHKIMQKYQRQQQQYGGGQQQAAPSSGYGASAANSNNPYEHHEGLEIPKGPNDQIGEISELIEALKGSLEGHGAPTAGSYGEENQSGANYGANQQQQQPNKLEDVRYLTSALGQVPSYAMQVPVAGEQQPTGPQYQSQPTGPQYQSHPQAGPAPQAYEAAPAGHPVKGGDAYQGAGQPHAAPEPAPYQQPQQQQQQQQYQSAGEQLPTGGYQQQHQQPALSGYGSGQAQVDGYGQAKQHQQSGESNSNYGEQQSAYGQQQVAPVVPIPVPVPVAPIVLPAAPAPSGGYGAPQQASDYRQQQHQQQQQVYEQQQQLQQEYQQQAQQASNGDSYSAAIAAAAAAASAAGYGTPIAHQQQQQHPAPSTNTYLSPAQGEAQSPGGYTSGQDHAQVINHLVPVASAAPVIQQQQQQHQATGYDSSSPASPATSSHQDQQQPGNQIAVSAPTDSHYQQAQSLSSFVDSLPTDYQELLRQPALIDGSSPNTAHLAALGQEAPASSSSSYGSSSPTTNSTSSVSSSSTSTSSSSYSSSSGQQHQQQQQSYQQQPSAGGVKGQQSSSGSQYSTVKK